jgi:translation initiation factor IF-3
MAHIDEGHKVMEMVIETLGAFGKVETQPQQQGRRITCMIAPK